MARVSFSPLVEEIVGKLAGSVFQDSYGGWQVRTRVTPRNPQSTFQQLRRGEFGFLSASWRGLSPAERQSFIDNAASPGAALNLFLQANVNLTLIGEPVITTYVPSSDPGTMQLEFVQADPSALTVIATGSPAVVPAGTKLLAQVTYQKPLTRLFTNPSSYSPVISFDESTDLSSAVDILPEWTARYGVFLPNKRLCLKTALIDKSNGVRGADLINCTNSEEMPFYKHYFIGRFTQSGTAAPTIDFAKSDVSITPTMARSITGAYSATFSSDFIAGKTIVLLTGGNSNGPTMSGVCSTNGVISFFASSAGSGIDNWQNASIEIYELP